MAKHSLTDLALFGGPAAFSSPVYVGRPNIGDREALLARLSHILDRRWLTNDGEFLREFERRIAAFVGTAHCVAFCNATIALEQLLEVLDLEGEVILPSFTFVASAHAVVRQRLTPVFCDIEPATHNLDPACVEALITSRTAAILGVHLWGRACDVDALTDIADSIGVPLVFDAAHAFGSTLLGRRAGSFGMAEVFSFHATKFVNTFEGGAVTTNDSRLAEKLRLSRNFGFVDYDAVATLGTNGKMSEIAAAMGITSLDSLDEFIAVNRANHETYVRALTAVNGIRIVSGDDAVRTSNLQYVAIEVEPSCPLSRDALYAILHAENVIARRYFYPGCHNLEYYRGRHFPIGPMPHTDAAAQRVLCLPTGTTMTTEDIGRICDVIRVAVEHGPEVMQRAASGAAIA